MQCNAMYCNVCMYVCINVCMYVCLSDCLSVCMYVLMYVCTDRCTRIRITEQNHLALSNMFCTWKCMGPVHILLSVFFLLFAIWGLFSADTAKPQSRCRHKNFGCIRHIAHPIFANDKRFGWGGFLLVISSISSPKISSILSPQYGKSPLFAFVWHGCVWKQGIKPIHGHETIGTYRDISASDQWVLRLPMALCFAQRHVELRPPGSTALTESAESSSPLSPSLEVCQIAPSFLMLYYDCC